eukprot:UN14189
MTDQFMQRDREQAIKSVKQIWKQRNITGVIPPVSTKKKEKCKT